MKTPFTNHLVDFDDDRFIPVLGAWVNHAMYLVASNEMANHTMAFEDHAQFWIGDHRPDSTLEDSIKRDLRKFISLYANSPIHQVIVGYATSRGNTDEIEEILGRLESNQRKKRAKMSAISSFLFSASVDFEMLDYPIPDINLVLIELLPTAKTKTFWVPNGQE